MSDLRIGLIGLDSSHAVGFVRTLNKGAGPGVVTPPAQIVSVCGWPPSTDLEVSHSRADQVRHDVVVDCGVHESDDLDDLADQVDAIILTAVDPRTHLEIVERVAGYHLPVFVDTRLTIDSSQARAAVRAMEAVGAPLSCASPKRFATSFQSLLNGHAPDRVTIRGPLTMQAPLPTFSWYGVHMAEMLYSAFGAGCLRVSATRQPGGGFRVMGVWPGDRVGVLSGDTTWSPNTHVSTIANGVERGATITAGGDDFFVPLLTAVVEAFSDGRPVVAVDEVQEVVRFLEAAETSLKRGEPVELND